MSMLFFIYLFSKFIYLFIIFLEVAKSPVHGKNKFFIFLEHPSLLLSVEAYSTL